MRPGTVRGLGAEWQRRLQRCGRQKAAWRAGLSRDTRAFQRVSGWLNAPPSPSEAGIPTQRGLLSRTGPFCEEKPLSLGRAARQAVHAPVPTAPAPRAAFRPVCSD